MTTEVENPGELEALKHLMDIRYRRFLEEQIALKASLQKMLEREDLSALEEKKYRDAVSIVENTIQSFRVSGIF